VSDVKAETVTMQQAINMALHDAMAADENVIIMGEDIADLEGGGVVGTTVGLSTEFGDRVRTTPISEAGFMGAAVGAAVTGIRPVVEIMLMNFMTVASDQVVNHAAKLRFMSGGQTNVPLTIRTMSGAGSQTGGQHTDWTEAWYAHTAGMHVVQPSNPADAYGLMRGCIENDDPCLFLELIPALFTPGPVPVRGTVIPVGKASVAREGSDVSIIGYGRGVWDGLAAAESLAEQGVSAEVVDLRSISPLDDETILSSVAKTGRAVVVHEALRSFGVGAEVSSRIHEELFSDLKAPVQRIGSAECPTPFAQHLEKAFLHSAEEVEAAVKLTLC